MTALRTTRRMVHKKCRSQTYPFGNVKRILIPDEHVDWGQNISYDPPEYEREGLQNNSWADPHIGE